MHMRVCVRVCACFVRRRELCAQVYLIALLRVHVRVNLYVPV